MSDRSAIVSSGPDPWNPTKGWDRVSVGCDHCYALALDEAVQGERARRNTKPTEIPHQWPGHWRDHPPGNPGLRRFAGVIPGWCTSNSMSDLFHARVRTPFIEQVCGDGGHPPCTYRLLAKRSTRLRRLAPRLPWPANVSMGVSLENTTATDKVENLRQVPTGQRFLSCEP